LLKNKNFQGEGRFEVKNIQSEYHIKENFCKISLRALHKLSALSVKFCALCVKKWSD